MIQPPLRILHLFISPAHNYYGHHGRSPDEHPTLDVREIRCVPGHGVEGDRFFDFKDHYKGQITFFAQEVFERLREQLNVHDKESSAFRRNVICTGVDLNELIGEDFEVQGVRFRGREECRPCHWMDVAFGPGAELALRGHGGLRAEILTEGILRVDGVLDLPATNVPAEAIASS